MNFFDGSALKALNKCRNPALDPEGPYCYVMSSHDSKNLVKEYCSIRACRSSGENQIRFIENQNYAIRTK